MNFSLGDDLRVVLGKRKLTEIKKNKEMLALLTVLVPSFGGADYI